MNDFNKIDLNAVNADTLNVFLTYFEELIEFDMDSLFENIDEDFMSPNDREEVNFILTSLTSSSTRLLDCISYIRKQKKYLHALLDKGKNHGKK